MKATATTGFVIETNVLGKRFNREWIFRKITHTFQSGNTYAITGPNGSGKSTLLSVLWGQTPPSSGGIIYKRGSSEIAVEDLHRHISIATPYMDLVDEFTLEEQLRLHASLKPLRDNTTIDGLIDKMYLSNARQKHIGNFSSGMRQRVKLALAFATKAEIIFLDEPSTNLDRTAFEWYRQLLSEADPSAIVFIASNNPEEYLTANETIDILYYK